MYLVSRSELIKAFRLHANEGIMTAGSVTCTLQSSIILLLWQHSFEQLFLTTPLQFYGKLIAELYGNTPEVADLYGNSLRSRRFVSRKFHSLIRLSLRRGNIFPWLRNQLCQVVWEK